MADGISGNKGIEFINSILKGLGVDGDINVKSSDVASIFSAAEDKNGNGKIDKEEFTEAIAEYYKSDIENISDLEDDYMDAWNAFAGIDNNDGLTSSDISGMNAQVSDALSKSDMNYANNENYTAPTEKTNSKTPTVSAVSADSLSGKSSADLTAERGDLLSSIDAKRTEKNTAVSEQKADMEAKKQAYDEALEKLESDEVLEGQEKSLNDLKAEKEEKDGQIENQNEVISGLEDSISSQNTLIKSLDSELSGLKAPSESDYKKTVTDEDGTTHEEVDTEAYNAAMQEYEQQKADLEQQKLEAENVLAELEQNLAAAEEALTVLEQEAADIDTQIDDVTAKIAETEADDGPAHAVKEALEAYNASQAALDEAESQYDADIAQLEENLSAYETAIAEAEAAEEEAAKAAENEQKAQLGLTDDERIQLDDEGNAYVEVTPWQSSGNGNDCLSRIMANNYDYEALGIERGSEEYNKLQEAVMNANSEIYGNEEGGGRTRILDGSRENSVIYAGDKITLPDAYEVLGIEKPAAPETPAEENAPVIKSPEDIPSCVNVTDTDTVTVNENGTFRVEHEDGSYEDHTGLKFDENGNLTSERVSLYGAPRSGVTPSTQEKSYTYDEENKLKTENSVNRDYRGAVTSESYKSYRDDGTVYESLYTNPTDSETSYHNTYNKSDRAYSEWKATVYDAEGNPINSTTYTIDENGNKVHQQTISNGKPVETTEDPAESSEPTTPTDEPVEEGAKEITDPHALEYVSKLDTIQKDIESLKNLGDDTSAYVELEKISSEVLPELMADENVSVTDKVQLLESIAAIDSDIMPTYLSIREYPQDAYKEVMGMFEDCQTIEDAVALSNAFSTFYPDGSAIDSLSSYMVEQVNLSTNSDDAKSYMNTLSNLYSLAKSNEDIKLLNDVFATDYLSKNVLNGDAQTEFIQNIMNNISLPKDSTNYTNLQDWQIQAYSEKYPSAQSILKAVDSGNLDSKVGMYLITQLNGGDISSIAKDLEKQDKYMDTLFSMFGNDYSQKQTVNNDVPNIISGVQGSNAATVAQELSETASKLAWLEENEMYTPEYEALLSSRTELLSKALNDSSISVNDKIQIMSGMSDNNPDYMMEYLSSFSYPNDTYQSVLGMFDQCSTPEEAIKLSAVFEKLYGDGSAANSLSNYIACTVASNSEDAKAFANSLADLYKDATPEQISKLNSTFDTASTIQYLFSRGTETEMLKNLFGNVFSNVEKVNSSEIADSLGLSENALKTYQRNNYSNVQSVLSGLESGKLNSVQAKYFLQQLGDTNQVIDSFRNMSNGNQEKYLPVLLELFGTKYLED